jgi:hypothetical protein
MSETTPPAELTVETIEELERRLELTDDDDFDLVPVETLHGLIAAWKALAAERAKVAEIERENATLKASKSAGWALARGRLEELERKEPRTVVPCHYESNGEAGDGQMVCDVCGLETDEPHRPEQCRREFERLVNASDDLRATLAKVEAFFAEHGATVADRLEFNSVTEDDIDPTCDDCRLEQAFRKLLATLPKGTKETMNIIVNGKEVQSPKRELSYADIVSLAGRDPARVLTVTYNEPSMSDAGRHGTLVSGQTVIVSEGMVFSVSDTSGA